MNSTGVGCDCLRCSVSLDEVFRELQWEFRDLDRVVPPLKSSKGCFLPVFRKIDAMFRMFPILHFPAISYLPALLLTGSTIRNTTPSTSNILRGHDVSQSAQRIPGALRHA